jgi:prophage DNA circulation protein
MGWRDEYQRAEWRGVAFYVRRAELETGRRAELHTFPNRDKPESEDLGRRARRYGVEGYLLGDDYFDQKETFLRAVEAPGAGLLVHPYYGELLVACVRCRVSDSDRELGIARLDLEFQETGDELEPKAEPNPRAVANTAKIDALAAINDAFLDAYSVVSKPLAEVNKLKRAITNGANLVNSTRRAVANVASYQRDLLNIDRNVAALVNDAESLAQETIGVLTFGTYPFQGEVRVDENDAGQMFTDLTELFDGVGETPSDDASPVKAYNDLFVRAATVTAGGLIPEVDFASLEDLEAAADIVFAKIDELEDAGLEDVDVLESLRRVRVVIRDDIESRADRLARTAEIVLPETIPALVLSNELYGDIDQEENILRRNDLDHPGYVTGRRPLKVLIDAG